MLPQKDVAAKRCCLILLGIKSCTKRVRNIPNESNLLTIKKTPLSIIIINIEFHIWVLRVIAQLRLEPGQTGPAIRQANFPPLRQPNTNAKDVSFLQLPVYFLSGE